MTKAKRFLWWLALNGAMAWASVMAVGGSRGCGNIVVFFLWVFVVLTLLVALNDECRQKMCAKGRSCPAWLSLTYDLFIIGLFAYHGWFVTAIGFFLLLVFGGYIYREYDGDEGKP